MNETMRGAGLRGPAVSQPLMRRHNLSLALRAIWDAGQITRTQLAQALSLSKPAITRIVNDLAEAGYVQETEDRTAGGRGRPSTYLELRPGRHYFIGVDFRVDRMAIEARDLVGTVLYDRHFAVARQDSIGDVVATLAERVRALAAEIGSKPAGIGVSLPVELSGDGAVVLSSTYFDWRNVPFVSLLQAALGTGYPVPRLDHISSCAAIANWREIARTGADDLVHIQVGVGAGAGFASRQFPTGRGTKFFRRFGHLPMELHGPLCKCGAEGCLDAVVGFGALTRHAAPCGLEVGAGPEAVAEFCTSLYALHREGSGAATLAITNVAQWFGRAAAIVINAATPSRVTLGGYPLYLGDAFLEPFVEALEPFAPGGGSLITTTTLGDEASVVGAVLLGVYPVMDDPLGTG
jgi:predicted NBD/HSP70 family sugar kinase